MSNNFDILKNIYNALDDKKGENIVVIDVSNVSIMMDYIVICHGNNLNQLHALADSVDDVMRKGGIHSDHMEGYRQANWILMDYKDIVINIFDKEARGFYDLEHIWADGTTIEL